MRKLVVFLWSGWWLYLCLLPALDSSEAASEIRRGLLLWALSAPLLAWALLRVPRAWPKKISHIFWNAERPALSLNSLVPWGAMMIATAIKAGRTPSPTASLAHYVALGVLLILGGWYRAALLSAPEPPRT